MKKYYFTTIVIFYHNARNLATECSNSMDYTTTNYSILLQNIVVYPEKNSIYHKM